MDVVDLVDVDVCLPPAGSLLKLHVNILAGVDHQHIVPPLAWSGPSCTQGPLHIRPLEEISRRPAFLASQDALEVMFVTE